MNQTQKLYKKFSEMIKGTATIMPGFHAIKSDALIYNLGIAPQKFSDKEKGRKLVRNHFDEKNILHLEEILRLGNQEPAYFTSGDNELCAMKLSKDGCIVYTQKMVENKIEQLEKQYAENIFKEDEFFQGIIIQNQIERLKQRIKEFEKAIPVEQYGPLKETVDKIMKDLGKTKPTIDKTIDRLTNLKNYNPLDTLVVPDNFTSENIPGTLTIITAEKPNTNTQTIQNSINIAKLTEYSYAPECSKTKNTSSTRKSKEPTTQYCGFMTIFTDKRFPPHLLN